MICQSSVADESACRVSSAFSIAATTPSTTSAPATNSGPKRTRAHVSLSGKYSRTGTNAWSCGMMSAGRLPSARPSASPPKTPKTSRSAAPTSVRETTMGTPRAQRVPYHTVTYAAT